MRRSKGAGFAPDASELMTIQEHRTLALQRQQADYEESATLSPGMGQARDPSFVVLRDRKYDDYGGR